MISLAALALLSTTPLVMAQNYDWDFALYTEHWPGTITQVALPANITTFTLHGVWPERNDNTWPTNCPGSSFDINKISSIMNEMNTYWPDVWQDGGSAAQFWGHEWTTHGACAADGSMPVITDELSFFKFGLTFHKNLPYLAKLAYYGITPDAYQTYTLTQFEQAFAQAFSFTVVVTCHHSNGEYFIERVYSCINKQAQLITCPAAVVSGLKKRADCGNGQAINFPPIQH